MKTGKIAEPLCSDPRHGRNERHDRRNDDIRATMPVCRGGRDLEREAIDIKLQRDLSANVCARHSFKLVELFLPHRQSIQGHVQLQNIDTGLAENSELSWLNVSLHEAFHLILRETAHLRD